MEAQYTYHYATDLQLYYVLSYLLHKNTESNLYTKKCVQYAVCTYITVLNVYITSGMGVGCSVPVVRDSLRLTRESPTDAAAAVDALRVRTCFPATIPE